MTDILPFLKSLISTSGLSGHEASIASLIEARWRALADEIHRSRLGSIHALRRGDGTAPRPRLVISAHMDAVGLMVSGFVEGFLRLTAVGSLDPRILSGQPVLVHGQQSQPGVIVSLPTILRGEDDKKAALTFDDLLVDVDLPPRRVEKLIQVGDLVSFATGPVELRGGTLCGHTLDNRASLAALTLALEALQPNSHAWDVWFTATVQEELTYAGAATSAVALHPDLAIIVDVTYAKGPGSNDWQTFPLGGGPTLGIGPEIHPFVMKRLKQVADQLAIPVTFEPMPELSDTEADAFQLARHGVPTAIVSIPVRNMHTPVEIVSLKDISSVGKLLAGFAESLEPDFLDRITWDD
jgi:endoglucanase